MRAHEYLEVPSRLDTMFALTTSQKKEEPYGPSLLARILPLLNPDIS